MIKVGKFYKVYAKDAYIISYLFEYKIKEEGKMETCGFPEQILNKVKANLENKKINYLILDRRDEYNEDEKIEFKNLNKYKEIYERSKRTVKKDSKCYLSFFAINYLFIKIIINIKSITNKKSN